MVQPKPATSEQPQPASLGSARLRNRLLLGAFYGTAIAFGLRNIYYDMPSALDLLVPISMALILWWWAVCDSKDRGTPIPILARQWFFVVALLLVPAYVIWSRGWRGLGLVLLHLIGWYALATVAMYAGWALAFGGE